VIVDDLDIERIAFAELKADTPTVMTVMAHCFFRAPFNLCNPTLRNGLRS
jgi:hypothetical protein